MRESLSAYAERVLGPCRVLDDRSWAHRASLVLELRDAGGTVWFAKQHRKLDRYRAEAAAYQAWVPAMGNHAPRLHAYDNAAFEEGTRQSLRRLMAGNHRSGHRLRT